MFDDLNVDVMSAGFQDELQKIAVTKHAAGAGIVAPAIAGAAAFELLRRANHDRKLGKAVRQQQGQQF